MVNRILLSLGLIFFCSILIFGQKTNQPQNINKRDFSGTWIPKSEKDDFPEGNSDDWTKVVIEQRAGSVKFTVVYAKESKTPKRTFNFLTDESGETNDGTVYFFFITNGKEAEKEIESKTKWEGDDLVTVHRLVVHDPLFTLNLDLTMRWHLSDDGTTLTRTMKYSNYKAIYKQKTRDGERLLELPVKPANGNSNEETRDYFVRLKGKK